MTAAAPPKPAPAEPSGFHNALKSMGAAFLGIATTAGSMTILFAKVVARTAMLKIDSAELWKNLYKMAVKSLPIVAVTALFTGAIMVIQAAMIVMKCERRTR